MGDQWGIGGFSGGERPILSKSSKKNGLKISKIGEIGKKSEKSDFFFTVNGLKCIKNPTKHL